MFHNLQFFHVNVNCSDLDRSLAFYKALGFKEIQDFGENSKREKSPREDPALGDDLLGPILGLPKGLKARARLLMLDDNPRSTRLDLIQWLEPGPEGKPYPHLTHLGIARICFKVTGIDELYQAVLKAGGKPFTEPLTIELGGTLQKVFCVPDPDGTILEFMDFSPNKEARAAS